MSGGVDSSVAACLLKNEGHEVIGLSFELWDRRGLVPSGVCCSVETVELAQSVARQLGIRHITADVRDAFYRHVIEEFCESYCRGFTPNPCILCNRHIKFDVLLKKAAELGAEFVATGHYARIEKRKRSAVSNERSGKEFHDSEERFLLKKGIDTGKDQSYVLYVMKQDELARTLFPLGMMKKSETRRIAEGLGLASSLREESQEICFVGEERYSAFIHRFNPEAVNPGKIVDTAGNIVGEHRGIAFYTIGQRRGLGIASPHPLYVVHIDPERNVVVVGSRDEAMKKTLKVNEINWITLDSLPGPVAAGVKIRSTMKEAPALLRPVSSGTVIVDFEEPQWAPAPGQSAVFYDRDVVLGGGIIE